MNSTSPLEVLHKDSFFFQRVGGKSVSVTFLNLAAKNPPSKVVETAQNPPSERHSGSSDTLLMPVAKRPFIQNNESMLPTGHTLSFRLSFWRLRPTYDRFCPLADVAQLVARNLAKVQVAGSNPVVRSR